MTNHTERRIWQGHHLVDNPDYIPGCKPTRNIWTLKSPRTARRKKLSDLFADTRSSHRLPENAWKLLDMICAFDFTGNEKYECESVAESLNTMFCSADLEAFTVSVIGRPVFPIDSPLMFRYGYSALDELAERFTLEATIFAIASKRLRPHVEEVIIQMGFDEHCLSLEEPTWFREAVFCDPSWKRECDEDDPLLRELFERMMREDPCGWIEIDNGFVCFSSRTMWDDFCWLFGIPVPSGLMSRIIQPDFSTVNDELSKLPLHNGNG